MLLKQVTLQNHRGEVHVEVYGATIVKIDMDLDDERLENTAIRIEVKENSNCIDFTTARIPVFSGLAFKLVQNVKSFYGAEFLEALIGKTIKLVIINDRLIAFGAPIGEKFVPLLDGMSDLLTWEELKTLISSKMDKNH